MHTFSVGFGTSPNLTTKHLVYALCLPSECVSINMPNVKRKLHQYDAIQNAVTS